MLFQREAPETFWKKIWILTPPPPPHFWSISRKNFCTPPPPSGGGYSFSTGIYFNVILSFGLKFFFFFGGGGRGDYNMQKMEIWRSTKHPLPTKNWKGIKKKRYVTTKLYDYIVFFIFFFGGGGRGGYNMQKMEIRRSTKHPLPTKKKTKTKNKNKLYHLTHDKKSKELFL